jgi:hypothetical protein
MFSALLDAILLVLEITGETRVLFSVKHVTQTASVVERYLIFPVPFVERVILYYTINAFY